MEDIHFRKHEQTLDNICQHIFLENETFFVDDSFFISCAVNSPLFSCSVQLSAPPPTHQSIYIWTPPSLLWIFLNKPFPFSEYLWTPSPFSEYLWTNFSPSLNIYEHPPPFSEYLWTNISPFLNIYEHPPPFSEYLWTNLSPSLNIYEHLPPWSGNL